MHPTAAACLSSTLSPALWLVSLRRAAGDAGRWASSLVVKEKWIMRRKLLWLSILVSLTSALAITKAQTQASVLDRIEQSIPKREAGWRLTKDDAYLRTEADDFPQAALSWTNDKEEVSAYVVVYKKLQTAAEVFEREYKDEDVERRSRLEGIGDAAFLWMPEKENGSYVLRFSKANVIVMMSSESEGVLKRCAKYIAESIAPPNNGMQRTRN
jgi:hypothetical protein